MKQDNSISLIFICSKLVELLCFWPSLVNVSGIISNYIVVYKTISDISIETYVRSRGGVKLSIIARNVLLPL